MFKYEFSYLKNGVKTPFQRAGSFTFDEEPQMQVLNGRFGPYISYNKQNYKIPKKVDATKLTLEECRAIVADEANASKGGARKRAAGRRKATTSSK